MSRFKAPQFWNSTTNDKRSTMLSYALLPFSWLYQLGVKIDRAVTIQEKSPLPVICIGNATMGGGGKTPTARTVLDIVRDHGKFQTACFLMRGYGGNFSGAMEVDPAIHTTWNVGDEALMQVRYAPTIVSKNRKKGAELAHSLGYDIIIMDDGFQNFSLKKDVSILVVDGGAGFGNYKCFPAGPLREPVHEAASRADAALIINHDEADDYPPLKGKLKFKGQIELVNKAEDGDENKKVVAFAGIARPEKFFKTLHNAGYTLHAHFGFSDHHTYTHGQLNHMFQRAEKANARLITTEKDWVRLSSAWKKKIDYIQISVSAEDAFKSFITKHLDGLGQ